MNRRIVISLSPEIIFEVLSKVEKTSSFCSKNKSQDAAPLPCLDRTGGHLAGVNH
jgi:hypothetical protein